MKRFFVALVCAALPFASLAAQEGRDFQELPFPQPVETGAKIEVREFFWYGCPHCYALEPALNRWLKKKPANVQFVRTPGVAPSWLVHAQAYYTFESLGVVELMHERLFAAIAEARRAAGDPRLNPYADESSLAQFAARSGVDAAKFHDAFRSFSVRTRLERAKRANVDYLVSAVPMLVVDGKYATSPTMAGGDEKVFAVVDQLVARATKERATKGGR